MYVGNVAAVIRAVDVAELETKLKTAIIEEVGAEIDGQFRLDIDNDNLDWGETSDIKTSYVQDGFLIEDNEFTLTKTVSY